MSRASWALAALTALAAVAEIVLSTVLGHHTGMLLAAGAGAAGVVAMTLAGEKELPRKELRQLLERTPGRTLPTRAEETKE